MKKIGKSHIFAFVLGAILFSGITGVAAYTMLASDIGYTPEDSTWKKSNGEDITNVKDAIDELYNKSNEKIKFGTPLYSQNLGDASSNRISTLDLPKGKYLVLATFGLGSGYTSASYSNNEDDTINLNCNNCEQTKISGKIYNISASVSIINDFYSYGVVRNTLYYVEINNSNDTINIQWNGIDNTQIGQIIALQAVPIN